jgi:hypothetical protein
MKQPRHAFPFPGKRDFESVGIGLVPVRCTVWTATRVHPEGIHPEGLFLRIANVGGDFTLPFIPSHEGREDVVPSPILGEG